MVRIDAQGQQQGIERHLHNPGGGESIAHRPVGHAHHVNALRQALKQGRDRTAHAYLFGSDMCVGSRSQHQFRSSPRAGDG